MPLPSRTCAIALAAMLALTAAHAQQRSSRPSVAGSPSATARTAAPSAAQTANARSPQGTPNPAGLSSPFPAGISSGSGAAVANDPVAASNPRASGINTTPSTNTGANTGLNNGLNNGTTVGGNGATLPNAVEPGVGDVPNTAVAGAGGSRGPGQGTPFGSGSGGFPAVEIARSFLNADGNKDGDLTRGEASRLGLALMTFEEMDRNYDGRISRSEYEDSLR